MSLYVTLSSLLGQQKALPFTCKCPGAACARRQEKHMG